MINQKAASKGVNVVSNDFATNSLNAILESVKSYRRLCRAALAALKAANVPLTREFEKSLEGLKEIRVSVFVSTLAKAGIALKCKLGEEDGLTVSISSISELSSVLSAAYDNDDLRILAQKAGIFEETLLKMIDKPGDISMPALIRICQAAEIELALA